jgi:hypothetical protein
MASGFLLGMTRWSGLTTVSRFPLWSNEQRPWLSAAVAAQAQTAWVTD